MASITSQQSSEDLSSLQLKVVIMTMMMMMMMMMRMMTMMRMMRMSAIMTAMVVQGGASGSIAGISANGQGAHFLHPPPKGRLTFAIMFLASPDAQEVM